MVGILLALAFPLFQEEDVSRWIEHLGNESIELREAASRNLQALGPQALARIEKARDEARDPEVKARLTSIIGNITKAAELAKAFGPTKRVTLIAKGRKLGDVLKELTGDGDLTIAPGKIDPEKLIDLELKNATWWQAMEWTARACGGHFGVDMELEGKRRFQIKLIPGVQREYPTLYIEQFRIGVVEVQRLEFVDPDRRVEVAMVVVEALYQPNLTPSGSWNLIKLKSIRDAKGADVQVERPDWVHSIGENPRHLGIYEVAWVRPEAVFPLTIEGQTDIPFSKGRQAVSLRIKGDDPPVRIGEVILNVSTFSQTKSGTRLTVRAEGEDGDSLASSLESDSVVLVDSEGNRHKGRSGESHGTNGEYTWEFTFPVDIKDPKEVRLRWSSEYHRVQIPFRLEGIQVPK